MIPCEFDILYIEDYSRKITYNELNSFFLSMTFCIYIYYIYNEYKYIKSYICLDILHGSNSSVFKYQGHYCENYKDIYELQAVKNVNSYILMPLGIKINNKNVFLISSYNNIYSNIVFFHNYIFEYTHLKLKNDILNQYTIFNDIILEKYNIAKNIITSKNMLIEMK